MKMRTVEIYLLKFTWLVLIASSQNLNVTGSNGAEIEGKAYYFEQKLDHFNRQDRRTWNQKFQVSNSVHKPDGPVVVYLEGERGSADLEEYKTHQWMLWAKELGAFIVVLDNRYFQSQEIYCSLNNTELKYLSSDQSLADYALLVPHIERRFRIWPGTKWVFVGGSYAGVLAVWFRIKYPHLVHSVVASSAPIHIKEDLKEFENTILQDLGKVKGCRKRLENGVKNILQLIKVDPRGAEKLFSLCKNSLSNQSTVEMLKRQLYLQVASKIQFEGKKGISKICWYLKYNGTTSAGGLANFFNFATNMILQGKECIKISFEDDFREKKLQRSIYLWYYLKCTEIGFFKTSRIFEIDLNYYLKMCTTLFGKTTKEMLKTRMDKTNILHGGKNIQVSRVIFTGGDLDPWRPYFVVEQKSNSSQMLWISGVGHTKDIGYKVADNSSSLGIARQKILAFMKNSLKESSD